MSVLDGIRKAFKMLPELAGSIGALVLTVVILALVSGVFIYQATTGGAVQVDGNATQGTYKLIADQSANFSSIVGTIWNAATSVAGFIVIGVIAIIAFTILGRKFMGGSKL